MINDDGGDDDDNDDPHNHIQILLHQRPLAPPPC